MANQEQVKVLKQGVAVWNSWRDRHGGVQPDLSGANLIEVDLIKVNLSRVDLSGADLSRADLGGANLSRSDLSYANLQAANLSQVDFRVANLSLTNLSRADLNGANLSLTNLGRADLGGANLSTANLSMANLNGANFRATRLFYTIFAGVDLCVVEGLDTIIHQGPSTVDVNTVRLPEGETHIHFLRGAGFSDTFIEYLPSLLTVSIQYESCFISYAHQDEPLAQRLFMDLQEKGVRCWFASHNLKPGDYMRKEIDQAIHLQDKLLLLLSESAIISGWVDYEVEIALVREREQKRKILFPLRLDEAVLQNTTGWAATLRKTRHIGDFTNWTNPHIYQQTFNRLLRDLKKTKQKNS